MADHAEKNIAARLREMQWRATQEYETLQQAAQEIEGLCDCLQQANRKLQDVEAQGEQAIARAEKAEAERDQALKRIDRFVRNEAYAEESLDDLRELSDHWKKSWEAATERAEKAEAELAALRDSRNAPDPQPQGQPMGPITRIDPDTGNRVIYRTDGRLDVRHETYEEREAALRMHVADGTLRLDPCPRCSAECKVVDSSGYVHVECSWCSGHFTAYSNTYTYAIRRHCECCEQTFHQPR